MCAVRSDKPLKKSPIIDFKEVFQQMGDTIWPDGVEIIRDAVTNEVVAD